MATKQATDETTSVGTQEIGIRVTVSKDSDTWLEKLSQLTGMSKGELINNSIAYYRENGRNELAEAIVRNAQRISHEILNS